MKLKTKFEDEDFRLGEVCEASITTERGGVIKVDAPANDGGWHEFYYESLKDMLDKWGDYEEPAEYWYIDYFGDVEKVSTAFTEEMIGEMREIGNYFETKEEAEKAVEKLKAWKRLKDKGFRFDGWEDLQSEMSTDDLMLFNRDVINTDNIIGFRMDDYHECIKDLNICFGGEE